MKANTGIRDPGWWPLLSKTVSSTERLPPIFTSTANVVNWKTILLNDKGSGGRKNICGALTHKPCGGGWVSLLPRWKAPALELRPCSHKPEAPHAWTRDSRTIWICVWTEVRSLVLNMLDCLIGRLFVCKPGGEMGLKFLRQFEEHPPILFPCISQMLPFLSLLLEL